MKVAIIPARGGSKRIPRKNIRSFLGKPIIAYSIEQAQAARCFDRIIVSTDDNEIAELSRSLGAEAPFVRPANLSDDHATTSAVMQHALGWLAAEGIGVGYACCIYATAPFIRSEEIAASLDLLASNPDAAYAFTLSEFTFPIQRALYIRDNRVQMFQPEHFLTRSQDLEPAYQDAGQFYWGRASAYIEDTPVFSKVSIPIVIPSYRVQDIDTEEDWERAERLYSIQAYRSSPLPRREGYACLSENVYEQKVGEVIYALQSLRSEDMESIRLWRNDQIALLRQGEEITPRQQQRYYDNVVVPTFTSHRPVMILLSYLRDGECIGYGGLTNINWESRCAEVSFLLDSEHTRDDARYRRLFGIFLELLKRIAFDPLKLNRLFTETYDVRPAHVSELESQGFKFEGRLRAHVSIGSERVDSLLHGILAEEYHV